MENNEIQQVVSDPIHTPPKSKARYYVLGIIVVLIVVGFVFLNLRNKDNIIPTSTTPQTVLPDIVTRGSAKDANQLNLAEAIPKDLKTISSDDKSVVLEGAHTELIYRVAIGKSLFPDGTCKSVYYNPTTKVEADWSAKSTKEGGDFYRYTCTPEEVIDGYLIPMISSMTKHSYGDENGVNLRMASSKANIATAGIQNNFYNQIYTNLKPKYSLQELDHYGNTLESIFSRSCLRPMYNGRALLKVGPNAGGCSGVYWQDSTQNSLTMMDSLPLDYVARKNFLLLLTSPECPENFVGDYLDAIATGKTAFTEKDFVQKLSCAGNVTISKGVSMPY